MQSKGNYKQGEMTSLKIGENNSKWNNWQSLMSKIYKGLINPTPEKQPNKKVEKRPKQTCLQRIQADG